MKNFINKILDVPKLILTIWVILWVCLVLLLIMKFCFGIWYPIASNNEVFNNICDFIDNHWLLNLFVMGIFYVFSSNLLTLTLLNKKKYDRWELFIITNICFISMYILKIVNNYFGVVCEILIVIFCILLNYKIKTYNKKYKNILFPILLYIFLNLWQFSIYFVRGLDITQLDKYPSLIYLIIMLDYYIFITITWIGVSYMGLLSWGWLFSKDVTVLKAHKEQKLAKKNPDMELVSEIDAKIAELEKEGK